MRYLDESMLLTMNQDAAKEEKSDIPTYTYLIKCREDTHMSLL